MDERMIGTRSQWMVRGRDSLVLEFGSVEKKRFFEMEGSEYVAFGCKSSSALASLNH